MNEELKKAVGIDSANCSTCARLHYESDGAEPECSQSWPVCGKFERYQYLKPFPFKTEQKCWRPDFWATRFTTGINGTESSMDFALAEFKAAVESFDRPPLTL